MDAFVLVGYCSATTLALMIRDDLERAESDRADKTRRNARQIVFLAHNALIEIAGSATNDTLRLAGVDPDRIDALV